MSYGIRTVVGGPGVPSGDEYIPFLTHRTYLETRDIQKLLAGYAFNAACDLGCGYGRLTHIVSEYSRATIGFERDSQLVQQAAKYGGNWVRFSQVESLSKLSVSNSVFDLVFSHTVLQHVPPEDIGAVCDEIRRVANCVILICEDDSSKEGPDVWGRCPEYYANSFNGEIIKKVTRISDLGMWTMIQVKK